MPKHEISGAGSATVANCPAVMTQQPIQPELPVGLAPPEGLARHPAVVCISCSTHHIPEVIQAHCDQGNGDPPVELHDRLDIPERVIARLAGMNHPLSTSALSRGCCADPPNRAVPPARYGRRISMWNIRIVSRPPAPGRLMLLSVRVRTRACFLTFQHSPQRKRSCTPSVGPADSVTAAPRRTMQRHWVRKLRVGRSSVNLSRMTSRPIAQLCSRTLIRRSCGTHARRN